MRITRAKQYRRRLRFFRIVYGVQAPYKVLLDGNFIHACLAHKVEMGERIQAVLQGEKYKLLVPKTAIDELRALGEKFQAAAAFATRSCQTITEHAPGKGSPAEQIEALISSDNPHRYIVASQDEELRAKLRNVAGCPLLYLSKTVLLMEQASGKTKAAFEALERRKTGVTEEETAIVEQLRQEERQKRAAEAAAKPAKRIKRAPTAPNPLSCLPKKNAKAKQQDKPKRKRK
ncbi:Fcf1-domain-containing protein, partial [Tribonema minus]